MPTTRQPRSGSLQFKPQKRAKRSYARVRSWPVGTQAKPMGFAGFKVGMVHVLFNEANKNARFYKENVQLPTTIIECPPVTVYGMRFYTTNAYGKRAVADILHTKHSKFLSKTITIPKSIKTKEPAQYGQVVLLVHTQPNKTGIGRKKPENFELPLGGSKEEQLVFAKEHLGKDLKVEDIFQLGQLVDVHSITKGKGFQGPVKRDGIGLRSHKSEKKRRAAVLAAEGFAQVNHTAHQPGKMGYNQRTHYNNQIVKIGSDAITPASGFHKYGNVKNSYLLLKGSIAGPRKSSVILTQPSRPKKVSTVEVNYVSVP